MFRRTAFILVLLASLLTVGSPWQSSPAPARTQIVSASSTSTQKKINQIAALFEHGNYAEAHDAFIRIARQTEAKGFTVAAIICWNDAGGCSLATRRFREALDELSHARDIAHRAGDSAREAAASSNISSLQIQMGNFEAALQVASDAALRKPPPPPDTIAILNAQRAEALANLHRLAEARPLFFSGISALDDSGAWDAEIRTRGIFGIKLIQSGDLATAEPVLTEALRIARIHRIPAANVLRALALLRSAQNNVPAALHLFDAALSEPPGPTPRWVIYADRGEFRIQQGDPSGALADFREARRLAAEMRADIVPADEDRVALEAGLGRIAAGIVNADNQIAIHSGDRNRLRESFEVAEQDRQWSLRALVPAKDDWRARLPAQYWDILAQYQTLQRALANSPSAALAQRAGALAVRLQFMEARTGGDARNSSVLLSAAPRASTLETAGRSIPSDAVVFSFYTTDSASWLWAITNNDFNVYRIPPAASLRKSIANFVTSVRSHGADTADRGRELYRDLFGSVSTRYTRKSKWLLELDGPLYSLPFPALVTSAPGEPPVWLIQHAAIQIIPGALLMEKSSPAPSGSFVGIGDPVYNAADPRYAGAKPRTESVLSRLPNTAAEVKQCAAAWGTGRSRVLTGMQANTAGLENALRSRPSIIHFATHVVPGQGDFGSGLVALSLDRSGSLGLLGPREILARPISAGLVVLDGCDSAQGEALPGAGLMGLTRAWIGAGAHAVLATLWDIPDDSRSALPGFYRDLRAHPEHDLAAALRAAQLDVLTQDRHAYPDAWAGYFLLAR